MCFHGTKTEITSSGTRSTVSLTSRLRSAAAKAIKFGLAAATPIYLYDTRLGAFDGAKVGDLVNAHSTQEVANMIRNLRRWHPEYEDASRFVPYLGFVNDARKQAAVLEIDALPTSRGAVPSESDTEKKLAKLEKAA
jgi:hypothetical protein